MNRSHIGIVGVGLVGTALAERCIAAGFQVTGYDVDRSRLDALQAAGGRAADSPVQLAESCDRLLLSLPTTDDVEQVLREAATALRPGMIVVDTTTGDPERTEALGRRLAEQDIHYLDATIAGSSAAVRTADVVVMAGGEPKTFAACEDLFATFARRAVHVGGWGAGSRMKLVVNLVLGINRAALAEGLMLAERLRLDTHQVLEILKEGIAYSRIMDTKGQKMLRREFEPQARLAQHLKDVLQILDTGGKAGARLPLSAAHRALLEEAVAAGLGDADNSAIIDVFRSPQDRPSDG